MTYSGSAPGPTGPTGPTGPPPPGCATPTGVSVSAVGPNLNIYFTLNDSNAISVLVQSSTDLGITWSTGVSGSYTSPRVVPLPTVTTSYRVIQGCPTSQSSPSAMATYTVVPTGPILKYGVIVISGNQITVNLTQAAVCNYTINLTGAYVNYLGSTLVGWTAPYHITAGNTTAGPVTAEYLGSALSPGDTIISISSGSLSSSQCSGTVQLNLSWF